VTIRRRACPTFRLNGMIRVSTLDLWYVLLGSTLDPEQSFALIIEPTATIVSQTTT